MNIQDRWLSIGKILCYTLLMIIGVLGFQVQPSYAHRPHDVIEQIAISPDYAQDKALTIVVRGNIYQSLDDGKNWQRVLQGFDKLYRSPTPIMDLIRTPTNKNHFFVATEYNGVYTSENQGKTWFAINEGLPFSQLGELTVFKVKKLAVSPNNEQDVMVSGKEGGLYLSRNGGKQWQKILEPSQIVTALAFTPNNHILITDSKGNILVSEDFGKNWKTLSQISPENTVNRLVISPDFAKDQTFFLATAKEGVLKTTDGGKTLTPSNQGIEDKSIQDIALSPNYSQDQTIALVNWQDGAYISKDQGKTWQKANKGLIKDPQADEFKVPHFYYVRFSPNVAQDKTLWVGSFNGLFRSTDNGQNWQEIESLSPGTVVAFDISPNYAKDGTLAFATYVGNIYHSQDQGKTWKPINKGLERPLFEEEFDSDAHIQDPRRYYDLIFSPNYGSDKTLWASILWDRIVKTINGGNYWDIIDLPAPQGRGPTFAVSPNFSQDQTLFVITQNGMVFRSTNGGKKFAKISQISANIGNDPSSIVVSPNFAADKTLYAVGKGGVFQSTDGGINWNVTTPKNLIELAQGFQLAISPNYAQDQTVLASSSLGLWITKDGAKTWQKLPVIADDPSPDILGVDISPNYAKDQTLMVTVRGRGLYKSTDGGKSFQNIGDNSLPITKVENIPYAGTPIHFSPNYAEDNTIFGIGSAKTEVFRSTDGGKTWETLTIPVNDYNQYDSATLFRVRMLLYRRHLGSLFGSILAAVLAYWLIGYAQLHRRLPLKKTQLQALCGFLVFLIAFLAAETLL